MNPRLIRVEPAATSLRRVGRLARRRMRIDGEALRNGTHTDGTLNVEISGLGSPAAAVPETFSWAGRSADRPRDHPIRDRRRGRLVPGRPGPVRRRRPVDDRRRLGDPVRRLLL